MVNSPLIRPHFLGGGGIGGVPLGSQGLKRNAIHLSFKKSGRASGALVILGNPGGRSIVSFSFGDRFLNIQELTDEKTPCRNLETLKTNQRKFR